MVTLVTGLDLALVLCSQTFAGPKFVSSLSSQACGLMGQWVDSDPVSCVQAFVLIKCRAEIRCHAVRNSFQFRLLRHVVSWISGLDFNSGLRPRTYFLMDRGPMFVSMLSSQACGLMGCVGEFHFGSVF